MPEVGYYLIDGSTWFVGTADCGYVTTAFEDSDRALCTAEDLDTLVRGQQPVDSRSLAEIYNQLAVPKGFRVFIFRTTAGKVFFDIVEDGYEALSGQRFPFSSAEEAVASLSSTKTPQSG